MNSTWAYHIRAHFVGELIMCACVSVCEWEREGYGGWTKRGNHRGDDKKDAPTKMGAKKLER